MSATLFVMVGLPGSGKTTRAKEIERSRSALRLTPDEWMLPMLGDYEGHGARDVLEGRFIWLALRALRLGDDVILDFGAWSAEERSALRNLAAIAGAECELVYLPVDEPEQRRRLQARGGSDDAAALLEAELRLASASFDVPDEEELGGSCSPPPAGCASWEEWISARWPTALDG
jgi:predicted kinase